MNGRTPTGKDSFSCVFLFFLLSGKKHTLCEGCDAFGMNVIITGASGWPFWHKKQDVTLMFSSFLATDSTRISPIPPGSHESGTLNMFFQVPKVVKTVKTPTPMLNQTHVVRFFVLPDNPTRTDHLSGRAQ